MEGRGVNGVKKNVNPILRDIISANDRGEQGNENVAMQDSVSEIEKLKEENRRLKRTLKERFF